MAHKGPWKKDQFREFLQTIKHGKVEHWIDIAKAIDVDQDTITHWKTLPEAQDAITTGIAYTIDQMETSGKKDWRMWENKLKMLGINPAMKIEHGVEESAAAKLLKKFGLGDEGEATKSIPAPPPDST